MYLHYAVILPVETSDRLLLYFRSIKRSPLRWSLYTVKTLSCGEYMDWCHCRCNTTINGMDCLHRWIGSWCSGTGWCSILVAVPTF